MNQLVKQNYVGQDLAIAERTGGMSIAPRNVADVIEFGHLMSTSGHAVPKHLRGNPGACMAVAMPSVKVPPCCGVGVVGGVPGTAGEPADPEQSGTFPSTKGVPRRGPEVWPLL